MLRLARRLGSLAAIALLGGCSGAQSTSTDVTTPSGSTSASPSPTGPAGDASAEPGGPPSTGGAPSASASVAAPAVSAPGVATAAPAHSVSSATGAAPPAVTAPGTGVPAVPLTPAELETVAMCLGKKSMFSEKEIKLLKLADASSDPAMREKANDIRAARQDALKAACDRLRADGKL